MKSRNPTATPHVDAEVERAVGVSVEDLTAIYVLDGIPGFGPQKFKELWRTNIRASEVVANPTIAKKKGKRWDEFRQALSRVSEEERRTCRARAASQIATAAKLGARILTYGHPDYPPSVLESNNPVAVLYVRAAPTTQAGHAGSVGASAILRARSAVACVGSRGIRPPYSNLHREFALTAVSHAFTVVSGFALGADTLGHKAAYEAKGSTIVVMPCGLDLSFPPENRALRNELLEYDGAVFVSEFPFGRRAASLTLRKRNRLIVAFARGVLLSQSAKDGGAMNAYRFALEQKTPVATFVDDGTPDTSGNALIANAGSSKLHANPDAVFALSPDRSAYECWLRTLSSST